MQYFGGKSRISKPLSTFINKLLEDEQPFVDAFCGSCNVVSKVDSGRVKIANDIHPELISMWVSLQDGWKPPFEVTEEDYYNAKTCHDTALKAFVGFGCSYSGKYWGGYARDKSQGKNYANIAYRSTMKKMNTLKSVKFRNEHYKNLLIPDGALVYCDIPYKDTTKYSTGDFDHEEFYEWAKDTPNVIVSEYSKNVPVDATVIWTQKSIKKIRDARGVAQLTEEVVFTWDENIINKVHKI